ncbi:hypothetical protein KUCAC02_031542, partial [Chaenocephalus aceratus]
DAFCSWSSRCEPPYRNYSQSDGLISAHTQRHRSGFPLTSKPKKVHRTPGTNAAMAGDGTDQRALQYEQTLEAELQTAGRKFKRRGDDDEAITLHFKNRRIPFVLGMYRN